jgi:hypothetical protein
VGVRGEGIRLTQHGVNESGLTVVDVGDDRHVSQVGAGGECHDKSVLAGCALLSTLPLRHRIGQGNSGDEALSVGVLGVPQNLITRTLLHQSTAMHHCDSVREDIDDR